MIHKTLDENLISNLSLVIFNEKNSLLAKTESDLNVSN